MMICSWNLATDYFRGLVKHGGRNQFWRIGLVDILNGCLWLWNRSQFPSKISDIQDIFDCVCWKSLWLKSGEMKRIQRKCITTGEEVEVCDAGRGQVHTQYWTDEVRGLLKKLFEDVSSQVKCSWGGSHMKLDLKELCTECSFW